MISYPFLLMPQAYLIARMCDIISKIYHPFQQERISLKKPSFVHLTKEGFFMVETNGLEPSTSCV